MYRPIGITFIAVLQLIGAILILMGGVGTLFFRTAIAEDTVLAAEIRQQTAFMTAFGAFLLVLGCVSLHLAYGLFRLKKWAWVAALTLQSLGVLSNISTIAIRTEIKTGNFGVAVFQIAISAGMIYYLLRSEVRRSFGWQKK